MDLTQDTGFSLISLSVKSLPKIFLINIQSLWSKLGELSIVLIRSKTGSQKFERHWLTPDVESNLAQVKGLTLFKIPS